MRKQDADVKKVKTYADKRANTPRTNLKQGEVVPVKQPTLNKLSTPCVAPAPLIVSDTKESVTTAQRKDGSSMKRNASVFWSDTVTSDGETHVGRPQRVRQKVKRLIEDM